MENLNTNQDLIALSNQRHYWVHDLLNLRARFLIKKNGNQRKGNKKSKLKLMKYKKKGKRKLKGNENEKKKSKLGIKGKKGTNN